MLEVPVAIVNEPSVLNIISDISHSAVFSEIVPLLIFHFPTPVKTSFSITLEICCSKVAVTDFVPSIVTSISFIVSVEEPDQLLNTQSFSAIALNLTTVPELYSSDVLAALITS